MLSIKVIQVQATWSCQIYLEISIPCVWKRDNFRLWRRSIKAIWIRSRFSRRHYWQWHHFCCHSKKVRNFSFYRKKPCCKRSNKQTDKISNQEVELTKALTQGLSHSPVPKDDNTLYGDLLTLKLWKFLGV